MKTVVVSFIVNDLNVLCISLFKRVIFTAFWVGICFCLAEKMNVFFIKIKRRILKISLSPIHKACYDILGEVIC